MKTFLILFVMLLPFAAFSQAMHLPGAVIPHSKHDSAEVSSRYLELIRRAPKDTSKLFAAVVATPSPAATTTTIKYNATVISTNFTIPMIRINLLSQNSANTTNSKVSTSYFNSVGAGVNYGCGELDQTLDANGNSASVDFQTHYGFQAGFIFAANTASSSTTTTSASSSATTTQSGTLFAVAGGFQFYNLEVGAGYELGSVPVGQKRFFFTFSYDIPLTTLVNGGYKIIKATLIPATVSN
jgi:hypothetical protein